MSRRFGSRGRALACAALTCAALVLPGGLAAQEVGPSDERKSPDHSLHRAFSVPGGAAMEALKCRPVARPAAPVARPSEAGAAPAGSQEEELPLSEEQERELLTQTLPPPSRDELRRNLPQEDWINRLHQQLRQGPGTAVARIGIWGGSHMAAEFFVSELRRQLQGRFGAGGAGHINLLYGSLGIRLPVKALCRQGRWQHELAPRAPDATPLAVGLGLFALSSREAGAAVEFDPSAIGPQSAVRTVSVHYLRQEGAGVLDVLVDGELVESIDTSGASAVGSIRISGAQAISRIKLVAQDERGVTLLGAFAEDNQGLVLDNFGIAGASGNFWTNARADLLGQGLGQRPYKLVMLAYGTNDVTGAQWDPAQYRARFEATLESMRRVAPSAMCLLITPGDRASRSQVRSQVRGKDGKVRRVVRTRYDLKTFTVRHMQAAQIQREVGARHQCMTWDMSLAMRQAGGAYALMKRSPPWMATDLIHLTPLGYQEMAKSLLQWLRL
jgi:hypothetical protein